MSSQPRVGELGRKLIRLIHHFWQIHNPKFSKNKNTPSLALFFQKLCINFKTVLWTEKSLKTSKLQTRPFSSDAFFRNQYEQFHSSSINGVYFHEKISVLVSCYGNISLTDVWFRSANRFPRKTTAFSCDDNTVTPEHVGPAILYPWRSFNSKRSTIKNPLFLYW